MKILLLNTDLGYGGAEKMLAFVANSLAKAGYDVTFLSYRTDNNLQKLVPSVKREHIQLESEGGSIKSYFKTVIGLRRYIRKNKYDVAIAFLLPSQIRLVPACKGTATKVLLSQRADPYHNEDYSHGSLISKLNEYFFGQADAYVFQTKEAMGYYSERIRKKGCVIPNPVMKPKQDCEWSADKAKKRIVSVGRLEMRQKRQDLLIYAFQKFSEEYPEYVLEFYGDGEDERKLKDLSANNRNIKFCGVSANISEVLKNAAMFVLTSDYEGIPNALAEAMALGVPCISTDCSPGGAALLIENGINGLLVPCGNSEKVYEAMKILAEDPARAEKMGKQAVVISERFNPEYISEKWIKVIESCGNGK